MRDHPIPAPKSPQSPANPTSAQDATGEAAGAIVPSEIAALAAQFAAHGGGTFSPEFSASLAREIVFNEVVEQACLATGATGAAIVLARGGEMVCRACSGTTVPELGARLDDKPGISQECMATHRVQRCDDVEVDPRADIEASRSLGVRSVMVLPLLRKNDLAGLLEVFSTQVAAFGERDEHTLEVLAKRILKSLEPVPHRVVPEAPPAPPPALSQPRADVGRRSDVPRFAELGRRAIPFGLDPGRAIEWFTWALGLAVLAGALLLAVRVSQRLGWMQETARQHRPKTPSAGAGATEAAARGENVAGDPAHSKSPGAWSGDSADDSRAEDESQVKNGAAISAEPDPSHKPDSKDSVLPAGGLMVYQDGREVFRMPSGRGGGGSADRAVGSSVSPASSVEPAARTELSAAAAEDGLAHRAEPDYPEEARRQGIQGAVVLNVDIDPDGAVQEIQLVSGPPLLAQAAMDAVRQWRFKPHPVNGRRVEMQTLVTLNFRLPR
jgi:TonB family protein